MTTIRPAAPADLDEIWSLVQRAVTHMNAQGNNQWGEDYPIRDLYEDDIARGELFAAVDGGGRILGVVCLNTGESPEYAALSWRLPGPALVVHRMAVDPDAQGQGVGSALFAFAAELARRQGLAHVKADTYTLNARMQGLMEKVGFRRVGEVYFTRDLRPLPFPCFEWEL